MYYQVEEQDGYYRIGSPENVFCYLFVGSKQAALIDTGYGFGNLEQTVRSVTDKPVVIINTHGHCDHTGGNAQFEEVCYIGEKDIGKFLKSNLITNRRSSSLNLILETDSKFFGCFACAFFGPFRIRSKSCCL